jgi:tetratricopeptide (TPR) repeat protein
LRTSSKVILAGLFSLVLCLQSGSSFAQNVGGDAWKRCQSGDADERLAGCTAIIQSNNLVSQSRLSDALDARCWAFHMKGQYALAIDDCKASIRIRPKYSYAYNNLGAAYLGMGDFTEAITALNKAIELKPNYFWSRLSRARAYAAIEKRDEALRDFQMAVALDPQNGEARAALNALSSSEVAAVPNPTVTQESLQTVQSNAPLIKPSTLPTPKQSQQSDILNVTGRRIALLIGNSQYKNAGPLDNPSRDVDALASALRVSGFQNITVRKDLTREQMISSIRDFANEADNADWALVYFSGHGIEFGGTNYIIPVDAHLSTDREVEIESVDLGKILTSVDGARKLKLVILDACRSNPFVSGMRRTIASRSIGRGLAPVEPDAGSLVVYAAKGGQEALDGEIGSNSPFMASLVRRIQTPNLEIRRLFDYVRDDVLKATNRRQQPFTYGSLPGKEDFYFVVR